MGSIELIDIAIWFGLAAAVFLYQYFSMQQKNALSISLQIKLEVLLLMEHGIANT